MHFPDHFHTTHMVQGYLHVCVPTGAMQTLNDPKGPRPKANAPTRLKFSHRFASVHCRPQRTRHLLVSMTPNTHHFSNHYRARRCGVYVAYRLGSIRHMHGGNSSALHKRSMCLCVSQCNDVYMHMLPINCTQSKPQCRSCRKELVWVRRSRILIFKDARIWTSWTLGLSRLQYFKILKYWIFDFCCPQFKISRSWESWKIRIAGLGSARHMHGGNSWFSPHLFYIFFSVFPGLLHFRSIPHNLHTFFTSAHTSSTYLESFYICSIF